MRADSGVDLPSRHGDGPGGVRKCGDRLVLDSICCVLRSGCQWRMLSRDLMRWDAAHRWFTKWRREIVRRQGA
ncbi:transposase [Streptomyces sp. 110]|uniref:Transposase n=1 Tax=Streptomyces endocoffeicus TaxID=2898945 RepID=A0ABS1Q323_9ACTN|nr:transposase [Streptomyces endocoffeicus]